jgi:hypothetical protein
MRYCAFCGNAIPDPARAVRDREGQPLDRGCARTLAGDGQLDTVQLPILRAGAVVGWIAAYWSEHLETFVTIPEGD